MRLDSRFELFQFRFGEKAFLFGVLCAPRDCGRRLALKEPAVSGLRCDGAGKSMDKCSYCSIS
jgi:hypothetical protein